jgi:CubicO group peptidase (beta-lactamase class C family)
MTTIRRATPLVCIGILFAFAGRASGDDINHRQEVDQIFAAFDKPGTPGCALGVVRNGDFVYKRAYGTASLELGVPLTPRSVVYMGSVSKQFTAASVVLAAEQGYLSLDDDVRKYIPELPDYGHTITLHHMLHHTSGLRDVVGLLFEISGRHIEDIHSNAELIDLAAHQKALNFAPGAEFSYANINFFLLAEVVYRATGKPLSRFAEENIFKPLGMTHTRFYDDRTAVVPDRVPAYEPGPAGSFLVDWSTDFDKVGDGGLMSTVDDLLLWDRNFYENKLGKGTLVRELETRGVLNNGKQLQYGLGLRLGSYRGLPTAEHSGGLDGYHTKFLQFPNQRFSVICLCNLSSSNPDLLSHKVADIYLDGQFPAEPATPTVQVALQSFVGLYRNPTNHSVMEVAAVEGGGLTARGARFTPLGPARFSAMSGAEIDFEHTNDAGLRLSLSAIDTTPQIFEKFQAITPTAKELTQYAGKYYSDELQATYNFAVLDGKLTVTTNWQPPTPLEPSVYDEFTGPYFMAFVFHRDSAGHTNGGAIFAGAAHDIGFIRK